MTTAFVAIGRNEGERLKTCLRSLVKLSPNVVYVDSGSTDGSCEFAATLGVNVFGLDPALAFNMARARNAGWREAIRLWPDSELIHFVDGDCELVATWLPDALDFLSRHPRAAAVCGRRRERFPERSVFNRICDVEWNTPVGEAKSCGGDSLMRRTALVEVGGFNESLIAGEEPELCLRMRRNGWTIHRLDAEMTRHDANILRVSQWWRRSVRGGYGAADVAWQTGQTPALGEVLFLGQVRSALTWFAILLALLFAAGVSAFFGFLTVAVGILVFAIALFGSQAIRIASGAWARCTSQGVALEYGFFTLAAKIPQALGILLHRRDRRRNRSAKLIEYKS